MSTKPKVVLSTNCCWNAWNFRGSLMRALQEAGCDVVVLAPRDGYTQRLMDMGVDWVDVPMQARGRNPVCDLHTWWFYLRTLRRLRPACYLGFTIKPNVYGTLACRMLGIPTINNIAGLGALFDRNDWMQRFANALYRLALRKAHQVFFQNQVDQQHFVEHRIVNQSITAVLPGSGVDTARFKPLTARAAPAPEAPIRFLMSSRLLWSKGVGEYVEAIRMLRLQLPLAEWHLMGFCGDGDDAISRADVAQWESEGLLRYHGVSDAIHLELPNFDCFVLPSYYNEGTPRSLLEASSTALPIITTDWKGCRDVVVDGVSGLLCRPRDAKDLADKMAHMAGLSSAKRVSMGAQGRQRIIDAFSDQRIIERYLSAFPADLGNRQRPGHVR